MSQASISSLSIILDETLDTKSVSKATLDVLSSQLYLDYKNPENYFSEYEHNE